MPVSDILRPNSRNRIEDVRTAADDLRRLARIALEGRPGTERLLSGVVVEVPTLDLRDRKPWLQAAARLLDLTNTDLIDACNVVATPALLAAAERFYTAESKHRLGMREQGSWAQPTIDYAAERLIGAIAGLDAFLSVPA